MTQGTVSASFHGVLDPAELDAVAAIAAATDERPEVLDIPDTPDLRAGTDADPDPSPRPDDGPQDVSQDPNAREA